MFGTGLKVKELLFIANKIKKKIADGSLILPPDYRVVLVTGRGTCYVDDSKQCLVISKY